jgi:ATP-binding cassette subfamily B protein
MRSFAVSAKKQKLQFAGVLVSYTLATLGAGMVLPLIYKHIIDIVTQTGSRADATASLLGSIGLLAAVIVFYNLMYRAGDFLIAGAESRTMEDLNNRAFAAFMRQGHTFFTDRFTGSLVAQARRYTRTFEDLSDILIFNFWMPAVTLTGVTIVLFFIKPLLGAIFVVWIPVYIFIAISITRRKLPYDTASAAQDSIVTAGYADVLSNMLTVKTFAAEEREKEKFTGVAQEDEEVRRRAWRVNNLLIAALTVLFGLLEIGAMYAVIRLWLAGSVTTGTVVLVQIYVGAIFNELFGLGRSFGRVMKDIAEATEMIEIIEREDTEIITDATDTLEAARSGVVFDHVTFRYQNGETVFRDFSMAIRAGERVGIVGPSGAGKSTLTKLLLRFVLPESGAVRIDGKDIRTIGAHDLREAIAYVPQDTALFHRTIAENIAYGKPGSTREQVTLAARKAQADGFIGALFHGYETLVGERGVKLSGGERQRVAIARAILKNAPILVLDEATSSLDSESEHLIQLALGELMEGKTAIVIAHRLSTVRKLDRIVVLDKEGNIEGEGTHDELLATDGLYAKLWNRQTGGFVESDGPDEATSDVDEAE